MPTPARVVIVPGEPGPLQIQDVHLPDPGPYQVVVKQFASGICHSQLHNMHAPRNGVPKLLGHEGTGTVVAKGREVRHVKEGDRVWVTWIPRNAETDARVPEPAVITLADGRQAPAPNVFTWADATIADEKYIVAIPPEARKMDVISIISCAVITGSGAVRNTAGVKKGESVAVFGVGGVGLCAIAAAAVAEAHPIIAVDLDDAKLEFARKFGATHTVNASQTDAVAAIRAMTKDPVRFDFPGEPVAGVDYAFDCIGAPTTIKQIIAAARHGANGARTGGTAVLVGVPQVPVELELRDLLVNEKKFIGSIGGSCRPDRDLPLFLRWYHEGDLDLDALVTARYRLDDINEATTALEQGKIAGRAIMEF